MTSTNRKTITINLVNGKDDDLISWINRLPRGGRDSAIRMVLRCGLELPQPDFTINPLEKLTELTGEVQALKTALNRVPAGMPAGIPAGSIDQLNRMGQLLDQMDRLQYRLNQLEAQVSGYPPTPAPIIEAAPELTDAELEQRAAKLKKNKW